MAVPNPLRMGPLIRKRDQDGDRFERFNIVVAILIAGWVPSVLMLVVSYTILTHTLESKILRDRQTFVQLIGHLVGDDFSRTGGIIEYYQTQPDVSRILTGPTPEVSAQQWLNQTFYSHPRIDGMFVAARDGRLIASIPAVPPEAIAEFPSQLWREQATASPSVYVSPVHPRLSDRRMTADIVGAVRTADGTVVGYLGVSVLVERMGRRLSTIEFADQSICQVIDQNGTTLFTNNLQPNTGPIAAQAQTLINEIRTSKKGHVDRFENLYSFSPIDTTGWVTIVEQPKAAAYKPVRDLLGKITFPAVWLILLTAVGAWLAGKFTRRQAEAARRIEREVVFNEKILANMPSGIALVDASSRTFLQANDAFVNMAKLFGGFPEDRDFSAGTFDEVKIAPSDAIEKVLAFGAPFQIVEHPFTDKSGMTHFVNINLLRLQGAEQRIQGVLYLVEDKTRDVTLRQELIGANAAKDQFLALLSHELRNPLSPVIAMVGELEATAAGSQDVKRALEVIRRNVELEARLIDDLLDVTRISKGKLQLSLETVNVHEILQRAYEICREDIVAKNLRMEFRLRAESVHVEADPARLQQVFWNLIKNSVKFTPAQGRIIIETFNPAPEQIEIRTTDTGIGIEPEKIGKIFNAFEQGQSSITRRFGGLGLGLAISKAMVSAHNGDIRVESEGRDRGATFIVTLHTVAAPAVKQPEKSGTPVGASNGAKRRAQTDGPRLLVVDDHHDTCTGMKMMLERRGYRVAVAHSADEAVDRAAEQPFDLLISDIGLPDRSGYELMQELRESKGLRGIALSGFGMENDIARAREAGFSEHLTKPINFERLEQAIHDLLDAEPASRQ
ncbi:MAG: Signal transduction histidine kinase [uncultured Chthoniobacterales bacterium]|uniref:histidine kinase n=1 Tax=uncultured Chthoniobacterales bacterium TaxID=1836801 RepID=A0A6J4GZM2_9BACT|nr:MAG: Signal transduction histidine kinase [uncultured Chthoniobacterales bacterium]